MSSTGSLTQGINVDYFEAIEPGYKKKDFR